MGLAPRASLALLLSAFPAWAGSTWHVDASRPPGGDGLAWGSAFSSLDDALLLAADGDVVWVARGRYRPSVEQQPGQPRSATFSIPDGVKLYGGFAGYEPTLDARAGLFEETALSGDIGVLFDRSDNAEHVVTVTNAGGFPEPTRLDGFRVVGGVGGQGAGVWCFNTGLTIANCTFEENTASRGGAIFAQAGIVRVKWCRFVRNLASQRGGAIWGQAVSFRIYNSIFQDNDATLGGAIYLHSMFDPEAVQVANCVFHDNRAVRGGAVHLGGADFSAGHGTFMNCTFAFNEATGSGGAISIRGDAALHPVVLVRNSILWGNSAPLHGQIDGRAIVRYSNLEDYRSGPGNLSLDPAFVDPAARDLRLGVGSPSIDAGNNAAVARDRVDVDGDGVFGAEPTELDVTGGVRFADDPGVPDSGSGTAPIVDMGAFERVP